MAVFTSIEDLGRSTNQPIYLALGMFDGVHAGHQSVLSRSQEIAHGNNGIAVAFTFPKHPASFLRPESAPSLLMDKDEKAKCSIIIIMISDAEKYTGIKRTS